MKDTVIGYITGRIDGHFQAAERDKKYSNSNFQYHTNAARELEEVLNFIIDIPEGKNLPDVQGEPGPNNITVNMVNPDDLPTEVRKAIEALVKQKFK